MVVNLWNCHFCLLEIFVGIAMFVELFTCLMDAFEKFMLPQKCYIPKELVKLQSRLLIIAYIAYINLVHVQCGTQHTPAQYILIQSNPIRSTQSCYHSWSYSDAVEMICLYSGAKLKLNRYKLQSMKIL